MKLFMIVETTEKELPWFCGDGKEVAEVLGYKSNKVFHCALAHGVDFLGGLFRIEKVEIEN